MSDSTEIPPIIYIAGPYRAKENRSVELNIASARAVAVKLWDTGYYVFCPHMNTAHMELFCPTVPDESYRDFYLKMLEHCDAVLATDLWDRSEGSKAEVFRALDLHIPVYFSLEELHEARTKGAFRTNPFLHKMSALAESYKRSTGDGEPKC